MPLYSERQFAGAALADARPCAAREARAGGEVHVAPTRVIRCGTLFDATGAAPLRDAAVVVTDGRIAAVGPAATTPAPAGAEAVDWSDRFVMPGLIDCHSHASISYTHLTL